MWREKQTCSTWNSGSKCTTFFYVRNFSSSCYLWVLLSQPEVPITKFQMRMQRWLWKDVWDTGGGRKTEIATGQNDRLCHLLGTGLIPFSFSAPPHSQHWAVKDTNLGRLRFFPGQTDPTASPVQFYTSSPGVFISLIYSPNYDQAEISSASCCLQTHHGVNVESQMADLRHNTHRYVLCWVVSLLWTSVPLSVKWR